MKAKSSSGIYKTIYIIMVVICCCLERKNKKDLKLHVNDPSYLKISPSIFKSATLQ